MTTIMDRKVGVGRLRSAEEERAPRQVRLEEEGLSSEELMVLVAYYSEVAEEAIVLVASLVMRKKVKAALAEKREAALAEKKKLGEGAVRRKAVASQARQARLAEKKKEAEEAARRKADARQAYLAGLAEKQKAAEEAASRKADAKLKKDYKSLLAKTYQDAD